MATLHDDGCFTWKSDKFRLMYDRQRAGWRMDVYANPQLRDLSDEEIVALKAYEDSRKGHITLLDFARAVLAAAKEQR